MGNSSVGGVVGLARVCIEVALVVVKDNKGSAGSRGCRWSEGLGNDLFVWVYLMKAGVIPPSPVR